MALTSTSHLGLGLEPELVEAIGHYKDFLRDFGFLAADFDIADWVDRRHIDGFRCHAPAPEPGDQKTMLQEKIDPVDKARRLAADFAERAAPFRRKQANFPSKTSPRLYEAGLLGLVTAPEHGGHGGGLAEAQAVVSEIARGEPSTALVLAMHYNSHYSLRRFAKVAGPPCRASADWPTARAQP